MKSRRERVKTLTEALIEHYNPSPLSAVCRYKFRSRVQQENEDFNSFHAALKELTIGCEFDTDARLDEEIRDRIIAGVRDTSLQNYYFSTPNLALKDVIARAKAAEQAGKGVTQLQSAPTGETATNSSRSNSDNSMNKINETVRKKKKPQSAAASNTSSSKSEKSKSNASSNSSSQVIVCYRCGRKDHKATECRNCSKNTKCKKCSKTGHLPSVCGMSRSEMIRALNESQSARSVKVVDIASISALSSAPMPKIKLTLSVNGRDVRFEADSGSAYTLLSKSEARQLGLLSNMRAENIPLTSYTGGELTIIGIVPVTVSYKQKSLDLELQIVDGDYSSVVGLDWLLPLNIDIRDHCYKPADSENAINQTVSEHVELKNGILRLTEEFADIFASGIGRIPDVEAEIYLKPETVPIYCRARPVPYALQAAVNAEIDRLVAEGVYTPVTSSEWATPVVPVIKSDGRVRLVGDYSVTVNRHIVPEDYPIPNVEETFHGSGNCRYFSKFDISEAYMHMCTTLNASKILTVNTPKGLHNVNRMNYGVQCAAAKWQRFMESMLKDLPGSCVFYDDVKIASATAKEHLMRVRKFFELCRKFNIRLNKKKCDFLTDRLTYLGYEIDSNGVHKTQEKIEAVLNAKQPRTAAELKSFQGLVNYYARFVPNMSQLFAPLGKLLQKNARFKWNKACSAAFENIKKEIASDRVLTHFDPSKKLILATDASPEAIGAVLSHEDENGERPIAFVSRKLTPTEQRYSQIDKEALSIYWGTRKFFNYLFGRKFTLITDCRPLQSIFAAHAAKPSLSATRLLHYAIFLQGFDYEIKYRRSEQNANADFVSRFPYNEVDVNQIDTPTFLQKELLQKIPVTAAQIAEETLKDPITASLLRQLSGEEQCLLKPKELCEYSLYNGCIFRNERVYIPAKFRDAVLREIHSGHLGIVKCKQLARSYVYWPKIDQCIEKMVAQCEICGKNARNADKLPPHQWENPKAPWQRVHFDIGTLDGTNLLILVDAYSKWVEVYPMQSITTEKVIECFVECFSRFGNPTVLISDNAPQFVSSEMSTYLRSIGVKHVTSPPFHPQSNGQVERYVQTVKNGLKCDTNGTLTQRLARFLQSYRRAPNSTTNKSPFELMFSRSMNTTLDLLLPKDSETKEIADEPRRSFCPNQKVQYRVYNKSEKWAYGFIHSRLGKVLYLINDNGSIAKRHANQIRSRSFEVAGGVSSTPYSFADQFEDQELHDHDVHEQSFQEAPASPPPVLRRSTRDRRSPKRFSP
ncbi:uncharacterized protein K02A2.6-like [Planococcus citri]|uniref:uncharacterized protein K02A2.6-like n=1 Tax=Planococcus citri TaxID=170843 RepID=UPI0031FA05CF